MSRPGATERASAYIASGKTPRAVAGQGGDKTTYAVACTLAVDFGLDDADVRALLNAYNTSKCEPRWPERDIERFVRSARRCAASKPGEVGKLLDVDRADYQGPRLPANSAAGASGGGQSRAGGSDSAPPKPRNGGSPPPKEEPRTARTALFSVRRAGEGAEPRTPRTVRTDAVYFYSISSPTSPTPIKENRKEESERSEAKPPAAVASVPNAQRLRAIAPGLVAASRDGLRGDALALYDALLRRGPMTRERLCTGLVWPAERLAVAEQWLLTDGWIVVG